MGVGVVCGGFKRKDSPSLYQFSKAMLRWFKMDEGTRMTTPRSSPGGSTGP